MGRYDLLLQVYLSTEKRLVQIGPVKVENERRYSMTKERSFNSCSKCESGLTTRLYVLHYRRQKNYVLPIGRKSVI